MYYIYIVLGGGMSNELKHRRKQRNGNVNPF